MDRSLCRGSGIWRGDGGADASAHRLRVARAFGPGVAPGFLRNVEAPSCRWFRSSSALRRSRAALPSFWRRGPCGVPRSGSARRRPSTGPARTIHSPTSAAPLRRRSARAGCESFRGGLRAPARRPKAPPGIPADRRARPPRRPARPAGRRCGAGRSTPPPTRACRHYRERRTPAPTRRGIVDNGEIRGEMSKRAVQRALPRWRVSACDGAPPHHESPGAPERRHESYGCARALSTHACQNGGGAG